MTEPTTSESSRPDIATVVPTQRIVTDEVAARRSSAEAGLTVPATVADLDGVAAGLPDFSAVLATVPGGLGAELGEAFSYAGQRWTAADAQVSGTPIGLQLAMEQRGLDVPGGHFELPVQRSG